MLLNLNDFSPTAAYHLMTQTVIPRPIAWVLTQNADGQSHNLAPYSYFNAVSSNPPLLMISYAPKPDGERKDTVINAEREKRLVIHIANSAHINAVQDTAKPLTYGDSELSLFASQLTDFGDTGLKRLLDAPIAFACSLYKSELLGDAPQTLLFAEIETLYVDDNAVTQQDERITIDSATINALSRLGLGQFADIANIRKP